MKFLLFPLILLMLCFGACQEQRVRKNPPFLKSNADLITGCYYISQDSSHVQRALKNREGIEEVYFINPDPIFTVGDFEKATVSTDNEVVWTLSIELNDKGKNAFARATEAYKGKKLAFIIGGELVMVPQVYEKITGGKLQIAGDFKEEDLNTFLKRIDREMYE